MNYSKKQRNRENRKRIQITRQHKVKLEKAAPDMFAALKAIFQHEKDCLKRGSGYDFVVHKISENAIEFNQDLERI